MRQVERVAALCFVLCVVQCERTLAQEPAPDAGSAALAAGSASAPPPTAAEPAVAPEPEVVELSDPEAVEATNAAAEPASQNDGLSEIVVTAQRRSTNLQQTPISITAVTGDALRERSANDVSGVADSTPNVQLITSSQASGGSNFAQLFIRGVGQTDFYITKDPAVGLYVDGVYKPTAGSLVM